MSFQWSNNSEHILSLFRPWNSDDGWDENTVGKAEKVLSLRFPTLIRNFYLSWGKRDDLTDRVHTILNPQNTFQHLDHLVLCIGEQSIIYWGIPISHLGEENPPINWIYNDETDTQWKYSHENLTSFLDSLLYYHALCKGAVHGGQVQIPVDQEDRIEEIIKQNYYELILNSIHWEYHVGEQCEPWTLYIRDGIVVDISFLLLAGLYAVARTTDALQDLENIVGLKWEKVW